VSPIYKLTFTIESANVDKKEAGSEKSYGPAV